VALLCRSVTSVERENAVPARAKCLPVDRATGAVRGNPVRKHQKASQPVESALWPAPRSRKTHRLRTEPSTPRRSVIRTVRAGPSARRGDRKLNKHLREQHHFPRRHTPHQDKKTTHIAGLRIATSQTHDDERYLAAPMLVWCDCPAQPADQMTV